MAVLKTDIASRYCCQGFAFGVGETAGAETGVLVVSVAIAAIEPPSTSEVLRTTAAKVFFADILILSDW
jgi:hypothetical protein